MYPTVGLPFSSVEEEPVLEASEQLASALVPRLAPAVVVVQIHFHFQYSPSVHPCPCLVHLESVFQLPLADCPVEAVQCSVPSVHPVDRPGACPHLAVEEEPAEAEQEAAKDLDSMAYLAHASAAPAVSYRCHSRHPQVLSSSVQYLADQVD